MTPAFLWLNALLFGLFSLLCTLRWPGTSSSLGYVDLNASGRSEYLTVYGGLQLGLGLFFALCALRPEAHRMGLWMGALLYIPIAGFRWFSVARHGPVGTPTLAVGMLETALACAAVFLLALERDTGPAS